MNADEWMILAMGMALAVAPMLLIWTEKRSRARGIAVPSLFTLKGYSVSPHAGFGAVVAVMLLYLSYQMRGIGLGFVFMVFGVVGLVVVLNHVQKSKGA
ncbi:hypothetical protein [uncultured Parvibaculum sp.]|uniref:hypothetical protein n=1 Tax=uncultured Parvibaculum sp. TaxID=291828 RepID=UPI0030DA8C01|tara:strand:+ start:1045 stop:1341 length:297 start_codon:yes stop_codon:yes gene_type:complete